jgi:hypothetical protein
LAFDQGVELFESALNGGPQAGVPRLDRAPIIERRLRRAFNPCQRSLDPRQPVFDMTPCHGVKIIVKSRQCKALSEFSQIEA